MALTCRQRTTVPQAFNSRDFQCTSRMLPRICAGMFARFQRGFAFATSTSGRGTWSTSSRRSKFATTSSAANDDQAAASGAPLEALPWDHTFVRELPGDPDTRNVVREVTDALYSRVSPTPPAGQPYLIAASEQVARLIGLDPAQCGRPEFALLMSGAAPLPGSLPYAGCYGGHQFGDWAGQLGDGRAITLGEILHPSTHQRWEVQLKGAGRTPYSRRGDGRAVLRSCVREYCGSEALAALGVPTTRALCLVGTGERIPRDMFYSGDVRLEPGAVLCRVAPCLVRLGSFQLPASRGAGQLGLVRQLADWVIRYHYPQLQAAPQPYLALLREVTHASARLTADWMALGFVHGVLNTDNLSVVGLTLDYGPFGFLDAFDPDWTPNLTDTEGRYSFRQQPRAVQWGLLQWTQALLAGGLLGREEAEGALNEFAEVLSAAYHARMAAKLGLLRYDPPLCQQLMRLMAEDAADFTNTFRALCGVQAGKAAEAGAAEGGGGATESNDATSPGPMRPLPPALAAALNGGAPLPPEREAAWRQWLAEYRDRLRAEGQPDAPRQAAQRRSCPAFIPRQHLMHAAAEAAEGGDFAELAALMRVLERPYDEQPEADPKYRSPPPRELRLRPGVCSLSCSS